MRIDEFEALGDLYNAVMRYFKRNEIIRLDQFMPYYFASMGCHVLNIYNKTERVIYTRHGTIPDLRLHMFFIGPPGSSKSFFCDILFDKMFGAAWNEKEFGFPNKEVGYLNLASLIGTVVGKDEEGKQITERGLAEKFDKAIIWAEEFTGIREVMRTEYSAGFGDAFLKLCDNGHVERNMRFGEINYQSYSTMWLGTQTQRMDLPSGLSRRFLFLDLNMTLQDFEDMRKAWHDGRDKSPDTAVLKELRSGFQRLYYGIKRLKRIKFSDQYIKWLRSIKTPHINLDILERLAIGYNLMTTYNLRDSTLVIKATPELKKLMIEALNMKYYLLGHQEWAQVEKMMQGQGRIKLTNLKKMCVDGGVGTYKETGAILEDMKRNGVVDRVTVPVKGVKRHVTYYWLVLDDPGIETEDT